MKDSLETDYTDKDNLLNWIKNNQGLTFRQIRFRLEMNEGTLNNSLKNLIKLGLIFKTEDKRYFYYKHGKV
mgnify:CR=1 FL=1